jgi:hypothetical protein
MEGTDPEELRSESAKGGHAAPRLPALPLHAGLPSVLSDDDHVDDDDAAFQHDWRSNDGLFFAHYNAVGRNDDSSYINLADYRSNASLLRGWLMQECEPSGTSVVSGRRAVLGLPHDGQQDLRHAIKRANAKRRHPSSQANGAPAHGFDDCA